MDGTVQTNAFIVELLLGVVVPWLMLLSSKGTDFSFMAAKGRDVKHLIGATDYIDFKALGYPGDPIIHGGRFKQLPMGYKAHK